MADRASSGGDESKKEKEDRERGEKLRAMRVKTPITVFRNYFHVSNSGVTFSVTDHGSGPTLNISTSAFGNLVNNQTLYLSKEALTVLGLALVKAADVEFSPAYCHAADDHTTLETDSSTGSINTRAQSIGDRAVLSAIKKINSAKKKSGKGLAVAKKRRR